jgi:hypothetical protein
MMTLYQALPSSSLPFGIVLVASAPWTSDTIEAIAGYKINTGGRTPFYSAYSIHSWVALLRLKLVKSYNAILGLFITRGSAVRD